VKFPALLVGLIALAASACQKHDETAATPKTAGPAAEAPRNEIPAAELSAVMEAHFQGAGFMEQYEYGKAAKAFVKSAGARRTGSPVRSTCPSHCST